MEYIIAFFKEFIRIILKLLFKEKEEMNFIAFDEDVFLTSNGNKFLVKEVS